MREDSGVHFKALSPTGLSATGLRRDFGAGISPTDALQAAPLSRAEEYNNDRKERKTRDNGKSASRERSRLK